MGNDIILAMAAKLYESFGDGYKIYRDDVQQELEQPCFFLATVQPSERPLLGNRYRRLYSFNVTCIPVDDGTNGDLYDVAETLMEHLEWIPLETGLIRGSDISYRVDAGVLHFQISYNVLIYKVAGEAEAPMEDLSMEGGVNG